MVTASRSAVPCLRRGAVVLASAVLLLITSEQVAEAQWPWSYTPVEPQLTPIPNSTFRARSGICKEGDGTVSSNDEVPDGGIIKINTTLTTDAWVVTAGKCERRIFGQFHDYQHHWATMVRVQQLTLGADPANDANWNPGYFNQYSSSYVLNSIPGTNPNPNPPPADNTTPAVSLAVNVEGEHKFRYKLFTPTTDCGFPASSPYSNKTLNAVACLPNWLKDGPEGNTGNPILPRFPSGEIKITYPSAIDGTVRAAVGGWVTALAAFGGIGRTFVYLPGGQCLATDEACVDVYPDLQSTNQFCGFGACGCRQQGGPLNNNEYTNRSRIIVHPTWTAAQHAAFLEWLIAHELGHLFGLHHLDVSQCTRGTALMIPTAGACGTINGDATSAKPSDAHAVAKTVYGNGPTKTCGWIAQ